MTIERAAQDLDAADRRPNQEITVTTSRTTSPRRALTSRRTVAVTGLTCAAALVLVGCGSTDDTADRPAATGSSSPGTTAPTTLDLPDPGVSSACAELTPDTMAAADLAFAGTVDSVEDGRVVLTVDQTYTGDPRGTVTVPQGDDAQPSEFSPGTFTEGESYLVASVDGTVLTCGQTGPATPELQALYDAVY